MPVLEDCHHPSSRRADKLSGDLQPFFKYSPEDLQLWQHLEKWYFEVQDNAYHPILLNGSMVDETNEFPQTNNLNSFDKDTALVRDKKLKFYRPRFHYTELKIKNALLLCVLISEQLFAQLSYDQPLPSNQSKLSFMRSFIGHYMNYTDELLFNDYNVDLYYFYPEITIEAHETKVTNNLMISSNKGHNWDSIRIENGQPRHVAMIGYLLEKQILTDYSFVFLFKHDTFVSAENLFNHLHSLSASDYVFSTWHEHPHRSKSNDFIRRNLAINDSLLNYGLLMSSSLLIQCQLNVPCLQGYFVEQLNIAKLESNTCQWHKAYHIQSSNLSSKIFANLESHRESIFQAISIYPVDYRSEVFHMIRLLTSHHRISRLESELNRLGNRILSLFKKNSIGGTRMSWPLGVFNYQKARTRYELIRWTYWNASHALMPNDIQVVRPLSQSELAEVAALEKTCKHWLQLHKPSFAESRVSLESAYRKFDAIRGLEYIVDLRSHSSMEPSQRGVRLQVVKPLNPVELMTEVPYVTETMRLTLVLPVRGEMEVPLAIKFLNNYASVCLKKANHQTMLIIALIYTRHFNVTDSIEAMFEYEKQEFDRLKKVSLFIQSKFSANSVKIVFMDLSPPDPSGWEVSPSRLSRYPSELVYLDIIARSLTASSEEPFLLLHCRTNMLFSMDFLTRVRLNTIVARQVFLPIPFVEYRLRTTISNSLFQRALHQSQWSDKSSFSASIDELVRKAKELYFDVRKENGFFDETNFEFASFYLSDYIRARQMSESLIPIVRNHHSIVKYQHLYYNAKIDLKHLFDATGTLVHMRAVDPELRLFHSSILDSCEHFESNVYSFESCSHRQLYGLGPKQKLASIVIEYVEMKQQNHRKVPN